MESPAALDSAVQAVLRRPIWHAWQGYGSHLFFECGEPRVRIGERVRGDAHLFGTPVQRRDGSITSDAQILIELAAWSLFAGELEIVHSESSREEIRAGQKWICGQHLVALTRQGTNLVTLQFDLGARLELRPPDDQQPDDELLSLVHGERVTSLRTNGSVTVRPLPDSELDAPHSPE